jgi:hypothetical protein
MVEAVVMHTTAGTLEARFGDGIDALRIVGATVNHLSAVEMGGGQDIFKLVNSSKAIAGQISMGAGNDEVFSAKDSRINPRVPGGPSYDKIWGTTVTRRGSFEYEFFQYR